MIAKILAVLLMLFGVLLCSILLYEQRWYFWLLMAGEQGTGQIVDISPAGEQALSRSRYNLSSPASVEAYDVSVLFSAADVEYRATTRLDFYQINALLDNTFTLSADINQTAFSGQPLGVIYLAQDPRRNRVDAALTWSAYWYPMTGGVAFLSMGIALWRVVRR